MTILSKAAAAFLVLAAALPAVAAPPAAPTPPEHRPAPADTTGLRSLPPGPRPIPVAIGAYLIDLERIEEASGTCSVSGYLNLEWTDSRLRRGATPGLDTTELSVEKIWWPNIEFYNQYDPRDVGNVQLNVNERGQVAYEERFRARLACDLDFHRFPFDQQQIPIEIESFRYDTRDMIFTIRPQPERRSARAFLPDWFIRDVSERLEIDSGNPDARPYADYVFTIRVERKSASYIWNIFVPMALITILSWVVFWIHNKDFTNIAITTLVAAVAFAMVVAGGRPRQSYMSFMDAVSLSSYVIIFLANVTAIAVHHLEWTDRRGEAAVVSRAARWAFPCVYVLLLGVSVIGFLVRD